jgi:hypothetical protein
MVRDSAVRNGRPRIYRRRLRWVEILLPRFLVVLLLASGPALILAGRPLIGAAAAAVFFLLASNPGSMSRRDRLARSLEQRRRELNGVRAGIEHVEREISASPPDRPDLMELRRQRVLLGGLSRSLESEIRYLERRTQELGAHAIRR